MKLPPRLEEFIAWLRAVWPTRESELVRAYRAAFLNQPDVIRDLAEFTKYNSNVSSDELERVEGRREVFRHIQSMLRMDPRDVDDIIERLEGD